MYCIGWGRPLSIICAISSNHTESDRNSQILVKLQSLVFGHKEVEKFIYLSLKRPKNGTSGAFSNAKVSRTILHSKHFYTHTILVKRVYDNNYCHPYFKDTPKYKKCWLKRWLHHVTTLHLRNIILLKLLTPYATRKYGVCVRS